MGCREFREDALTAFGQRDPHLPPVVRGHFPHDEFFCDQPIDQTHRAVMTHLQLIRKFPDRYLFAPRKPFDRKQPLMLLR